MCRERNLPRAAHQQKITSVPDRKGERAKRAVKHLTVVANTSNSVNARVAHTITGTNFSVLVLYRAQTGNRGHESRLIDRINGGSVHIVRISLSSVASIGGITGTVLGSNERVSLLVGGTNAVDGIKFITARSKLRHAITIGCVKRFLLAAGLLPLVKQNAHVIGVVSLACTVKEVAPSFFAHKYRKDF